MEKKADLHVHTKFSDGTFTPKEVINHAKKQGLDCIAIADHDNVNAIPQAMKLQDSYDIEIIPAVEITAQEGHKELHILGYYVNWQDKTLIKRLNEICQGRVERIYKIADKLKTHGIDADADEIIEYARGSSISRLHVARYLVQKGLVPSLREVFSKYIGDGKPCYVSGFRFSTKEITDIIKRSGGAAVIAHPGLNNVSEFLPTLVQRGIEGIEVFHSDHKKIISDALYRFAKKQSLLITGGSDCHGENKRKVLIGNIKLPYEYVEKLKEHVKHRQ